MTQEVLKLALDALEDVGGEWGFTSQRTLPKRMNVIEALRAALAQPEQEPVAWFSPLGNLYKTRFHATANGEQVITPLYTTPQRTWVGLTDEEIAKEFYKFEAAGAWYQFARAIEAKLKEKNT